jgi:hypothetical protein
MLLRRLREAIREKGRDAAPATVIKCARVAGKPARDTLRDLERLGEYAGFSRARPQRFRSK